MRRRIAIDDVDALQVAVQPESLQAMRKCRLALRVVMAVAIVAVQDTRAGDAAVGRPVAV